MKPSEVKLCYLIGHIITLSIVWLCISLSRGGHPGVIKEYLVPIYRVGNHCFPFSPVCQSKLIILITYLFDCINLISNLIREECSIAVNVKQKTDSKSHPQSLQLQFSPVSIDLLHPCLFLDVLELNKWRLQTGQALQNFLRIFSHRSILLRQHLQTIFQKTCCYDGVSLQPAFIQCSTQTFSGLLPWSKGQNSLSMFCQRQIF